MWICYHPNLRGPHGLRGLVSAFDPANGCNPVLVAERGIDISGCFAGQTMITMGDGSLKRADAIRSGDEVYSPIVGQPMKVNKVVAGPEVADLLEITVGDRRVEVSQLHPFMTRFGPVAAKNLKIGDTILDTDHKSSAIVAIRTVAHKKPVTVWNFILDGGADPRQHLLVGDGIVSGDLVLQSQTVLPNAVRFAFDSDDAK